MLEYPSILRTNQSPKKYCIAFNKLDGSNIRAKWSRKKGFHLFGTRRQLINETTPFWNQAILQFKTKLEEPLNNLIQKEFKQVRELIVFSEFAGPNSFAGMHVESDKFELIPFDIYIGHKRPYFLDPLTFTKYGSKYEFPFPEVIYTGKLNSSFISNVRSNKYNLKEGVVCKGTDNTNSPHGIWMSKIKTDEWIAKVKNKCANWKELI